MAFKDNFKKFIETQVEATIDLIFANAHGYAMTESGDIYPEQVFELDKLKKQLQDLVYQQTVDNLTQEQKQQYSLTGNMTDEEVEQHCKDHPMEPLDICSKCSGSQVHGSMKSLNDSINCTALICDDCAASEDTVYNRCANCDFDMGENYENCGGAEDGTCPECGHQKKEETVFPIGYEGTFKGRDYKVINRGLSGNGNEHHRLVEFKDNGEMKDYHKDVLQEAAKVLKEPVLWNVPVMRTGYGHGLIAVTARSEEEAIALALDEAGGEEFSEKSSEYTAPDGAHKIG
jgi:hypothetical protein